MGAPYYNHNNPINGAIIELASALSALSMTPSPKSAEELEGLTPDSGDEFFLSRGDHWVEHSCEHITAALDHLYAIQNLISDMRDIDLILNDPHRVTAGVDDAALTARKWRAPIAFEERVK